MDTANYNSRLSSWITCILRYTFGTLDLDQKMIHKTSILFRKKFTSVRFLAAEDNSVESGLQLLKRRRPRNALQLDRPSMEAFSPSSTSERLDREDTPGLFICNTFGLN
jgi:hypothetical protein